MPSIEVILSILVVFQVITAFQIYAMRRDIGEQMALRFGNSIRFTSAHRSGGDDDGGPKGANRSGGDDDGGPKGANRSGGDDDGGPKGANRSFD